MSLYKLLPLLFLLGCGHFKELYIEPEFRPIVDMYNDLKIEALGVGQYHQISMYFDNLDSPTAGICYRYSDGTREIYIDKLQWDNMSLYSRQVLIFHEMGHCDLGLKHAPSPSIMQERLLSDYTYSLDRQFYIDQLFSFGTYHNLENKLEMEISCEH
jgi:hypothetical protein